MAVKVVPVTIPANSPLLPAPCTREVVWALKSLATGEAIKDEQSLAIRWIIHDLCKTYDMPYFPGPDGVRDGDFAKGKMHVGQQLIRLINMSPEDANKLPRLAPATSEDDGSIHNM